jgi:hypothetical protein
MTDNTDAAFEQRLAELTEEQFDAVVARTRPHTPPPQTALERARAEGRSKAQQLVDLRAQSDERASDLARGSLAPTQSDQDAAAQAAQEATWQAAAQTEAPQGFTPNRGQGAAGTPPPTAETGAQKADRLRQLRQQQQKGF